jgi:hypothetical protein
VVSYSLSIRIDVITGGHHIEFLSEKTIEKALKLSFATFSLTMITNLLIKVSVAIMLLRIKQDYWWRIALWSLMGSCFIVGIAVTITEFLQCRPLDGFWNIEKMFEGACWTPETRVHLAYGWGSEYIYNMYSGITDRNSILRAHRSYYGTTSVSYLNFVDWY